jgi:hypothetical protein
MKNTTSAENQIEEDKNGVISKEYSPTLHKYYTKDPLNLVHRL